MSNDIRFITPDYEEKFRIPDGGHIVITHPDGEQSIPQCKYMDEAHFMAGDSCYHICQFAEIMERNGSKVEPETAPEIVHGYQIKRRIPVGDKVFVMAHNPNAAQPYVTWQGYRDTPDKDWGHYYRSRSDAHHDLVCRAGAERSGVPYDHTKSQKRDHGER